MTGPKPIPKSILAPLSASPWKADDYSCTKFARCIDSHAAHDARDGLTSAYVLGGPYDQSLSAAEFAAMAKAGAVRPEFYASDNTGRQWVNQHWLHSLVQFYAEVTRAWHEHCERTDALIGTPAGRIPRAKPE